MRLKIGLTESTFDRTIRYGPELDLCFSLVIRYWAKAFGSTSPNASFEPSLTQLPAISPTATAIVGTASIHRYSVTHRHIRPKYPRNSRSEEVELKERSISLEAAIVHSALHIRVFHPYASPEREERFRKEIDLDPVQLLGDLHASIRPISDSPELFYRCLVHGYSFLDLNLRSAKYGSYLYRSYDEVVENPVGALLTDPDTIGYDVALAEIEVLGPGEPYGDES